MDGAFVVLYVLLYTVLANFYVPTSRKLNKMWKQIRSQNPDKLHRERVGLSFSPSVRRNATFRRAQNASSPLAGPSFGDIFSSKHHSYGLSSEKKAGPAASDSAAAAAASASSSASTSVAPGSMSFKKKSAEGQAGLVVKKGRILSDSDSD